MHEREHHHEFHSALGQWFERFLQEKQACGYRYITQGYMLRRLDCFFCKQGLASEELPRGIVEQWTLKQPHEADTTQRVRIGILQQFARFLVRHGIRAYVPDIKLFTRIQCQFTPRIFRREEVCQILEASDTIPFDKRTPLRHRIMPEIFRLLYGCGLRVGEILRLTVADVDLVQGILTIRQSKFHKDRLVPMVPSQKVRLHRYAEWIGHQYISAIFFPAPDGGRYSHDAVYRVFRQLLRRIGISHGGRGQGPRLHDLRATFAVHRLESWYRQGINLSAKLPMLSAYMGHHSLFGTQRYLHLTSELFPDIVVRLESCFGHIIPRRINT